MRQRQAVFVDTGAWSALALVKDPFHVRARALWEDLLGSGARLLTSIPVVLETFTFLDRNAAPDVALAFAIMKRRGIRVAFTFDHHFAAAGFRFVG